MRFSGLCSYPHGGYTVLGLILAGASAMATTLYAASSCRFLVVRFVSETGNFETFFLNMQEAAAGRPTATYKVGIGLFQFLRPFREDSNWSDGSCAGYQESMLQQISDTPFETARFFAVIAIVLSFILVIWELLMLVFEFNRIQVRIFYFIAMMGIVSCGLTFMVTKSAICETIFLERQCELDEGGLVMIAACLMWFTTLVLSSAYLRSPESDSEYPLSKTERAKIVAELEQEESLYEKSWVSETPETRNTQSLAPSVNDDDDESGRRRLRELRATLPQARQRSMESSSRSIASAQSTGEQSRYVILKSLNRKRNFSEKGEIMTGKVIIDDVSHPDAMEVYIPGSSGRS